MVQPLGVHYLLELRGCNPTVINDLPEVRRILIEAAKQAKATFIDARFHQFSPQGVSGVVVVGESHLSIHTWPEYGYVSADIYTCGQTDPLRAAFYIADALQARSVFCMIVGRGEHPMMNESESEPPSPFVPARWGLQPATDWLFVDYVNPSAAILLRVKSVLYSSRSAYQQIDVLETEAFGRCFILDGRIQSAEADEFIYHEALVHPAMVIHPDPRQVLILGGGEGATLREVLRHRTVERVVAVEIDPLVIDISRRYLPEWSDGAFDDPRAEVRIEDAARYLQETPDRFDIIISDLTEPEPGTPAEPLLSREMFQAMHRCLKPGGILVNQAGSTGIPNTSQFAHIYRLMGDVFGRLTPCSIQIASFGEPWGFIVASDVHDPRDLTPEEVEARLSRRCAREKLRYYDGSIHRALFTLPPWFRETLEKR